MQGVTEATHLTCVNKYTETFVTCNINVIFTIRFIHRIMYIVWRKEMSHNDNSRSLSFKHCTRCRLVYSVRYKSRCYLCYLFVHLAIGELGALRVTTLHRMAFMTFICINVKDTLRQSSWLQTNTLKSKRSTCQGWGKFSVQKNSTYIHIFAFPYTIVQCQYSLCEYIFCNESVSLLRSIILHQKQMQKLGRRTPGILVRVSSSKFYTKSSK